MNKSNVLAVGVLLIALGLYLQTAYNIEGNQLGEYLKTFLDANTFILLVTILFWGGLIVVIVSMLIRPRRRKIVVPAETVEEVPRRVESGATYEVEGTEETVGVEMEQSYEEAAPEEAVESSEENPREEEEEKPRKLGEVIGFCPRCGAPVTEGIRYCRKCGLKLK